MNGTVMEQHALKIANICLNTNIYLSKSFPLKSFLESSGKPFCCKVCLRNISVAFFTAALKICCELLSSILIGETSDLVGTSSKIAVPFA